MPVQLSEVRTGIQIIRTCRRRCLRRGREAVEHSARDRIFSEYLLRSCDRLFRRFLWLHIMQDNIGPPRREHVLVAVLLTIATSLEIVPSRSMTIVFEWRASLSSASFQLIALGGTKPSLYA